MWVKNRVIIHDVTGYYSYLPALFIYDDLNFDFRKNLPVNEPLEGIWVNQKDSVTYLKASIGMSYFFYPSFIAAHAIAKKNPEVHANGYSLPYQHALALNTLIVGILGLWFSRLLLLKFFSDISASIALTLLYGGSNLIYYLTIEPAMTHPYSYFLVVVMLLLTFSLMEKPENRRFILLCLIIGWLVAVRPTNSILALYPFLLFIFNHKLRNHVLHLVKKNPFIIPFGIVCSLIPLIPQFVYWYKISGTFIFYSYDQEKFFFNKPHVWDGLFGYRTGFFLYSPVMLAACIGMFFKHNIRKLIMPAAIPLLLFTYVVFSWWCWWYGGFSIRVMIETFPFLLFGLAILADKLIQLKWLPGSLISVVLIFMIYQNQRFSDLYERGIIHWDSMTKKNYFTVFKGNKIPPEYFDWFEKPDYDKAFKEGE